MKVRLHCSQFDQQQFPPLCNHLMKDFLSYKTFSKLSNNLITASNEQGLIPGLEL